MPVERSPDQQGVPEWRGIQRGDIVAFTVVLVACALFVVLFALVPILGAPD